MRVSSIVELAAAVRTRRHQQGWTQAQLAERAQVSRDLINRLEGGSARVEVGKVLDVLSALGQIPYVQQRSDDVDLEAIIRAHGSGE